MSNTGTPSAQYATQTFTFPSSTNIQQMAIGGAAGSVGIQSITIRNTSNGIISVFLNGNPSATATPDFQVQANVNETVPVGGSKIIGLRFDSCTTGSVYVQLSNQQQSAVTSGIPVTPAAQLRVNSPSLIGSTYPLLGGSDGNLIVNQRILDTAGNTVLVCPYFTFNVPYNGANVYLTSARVSGLAPYSQWGLYFQNGGLPNLSAPIQWTPLMTGNGEWVSGQDPVDVGAFYHIIGTSLVWGCYMIFENVDFPGSNPLNRVNALVTGYAQ